MYKIEYCGGRFGRPLSDFIREANSENYKIIAITESTGGVYTIIFEA